MSKRIETITFQGEEREAERIEVVGQQEHWNVYLLEDGSEIRVKIVAHKVLRLQGMHDAEGNPMYLVQSANVMSVDAPKNLRKGGP